MNKDIFPLIISSTVKLRPFRHEDAASLAKHANNPNIAESLNDGFPEPYTIDDARDFILRMKQDHPVKVLAIEVDGEACGAIGVFPQQNVQRLNAELGYWLSESHWGKGITSAAVKLVLKYAFAYFDIIRIYARPFPFNKASQRVLEKAGFKLEARIKNGLIKNDTIYDELIYSFLKEELS